MNLIRYLVAVCLLAIPAFAQTATLRGQVTDESGAIVQGAKISLSGPGRLPGTYITSVAGSGIFPLGRPGLFVLMDSSGLYNQNQLILNVNFEGEPPGLTRGKLHIQS